MDMNAYLSMFIDESNDHLQSLNENLLKLESAPERHQYRSNHFPFRAHAERHVGNDGL